MNPQHLNYSHAAFHQEKQKWENTISNYQGPDPLELWYEYICWYEQNIQLDNERLFETILGKCLSIYESQQHYKQDTRLVKLWMKYIGLKSNPLNLYQVLYQRGIGTQCAIFYIGWAHYYDSANAFKQAESVYNLGFQANAQPYSALERAHKDFRFSLSQRMLYNDQQSKKRTVSQLNDQRQQLTSLNPSSSSPNATNFQHAQNNYTPPPPMNQPPVATQPNAYATPQPQQQEEQQQEPQQQQIHNGQQPLQSFQSYNSAQVEEQQQPPAKKFRGPDEQSTYNRSLSNSSSQHSVTTTMATTPTPMPIPTPTKEDYTQKNESEYCNQYPQPKPNSNDLSNSTSTACAIASSLNSVYSGDEDGSEDYSAYGYNDTLATTTETTKYMEETPAYLRPISCVDQSSHPGGCNLPPKFATYAKNHYDTWNWPIFLDEPDTNKICKYPRHLVYPGNGNEYSLEEIRARNYTKVIEAIKERNRQREIAVNEHRQYNRMQNEQKTENQHQMSQPQLQLQYQYQHQHQQPQQQQQQQQQQLQQQQQHQQQQQQLQQQQLQQQQLQQQQQQQQQQRQQHRQLEEQRAFERQRLAQIEQERIMKEREQSRLAALELQRAKEKEEQQRRLAEQQKLQQMQEQTAYQHQQQPTRNHIHAAPHSQPINNHSNYYEQNQSPMYNNYVNYPASNQQNSSPSHYPPNHPNSSTVPYPQNQHNSSPVPYQHPNNSPAPYQQNHQTGSPAAYQQNHQNSYGSSIPFQQMQTQVSQPQLPPQQNPAQSMSQQSYYNHNKSSTAIQFQTPPMNGPNEIYGSQQSRYPSQPVPQPYHQNHIMPTTQPMHMQYQDASYHSPQYASQSQTVQYPPQPQPMQQNQHQQIPSQLLQSHQSQNHHQILPYPQQSQTIHSEYQYQMQPTAVPVDCNSDSDYNAQPYSEAVTVTEMKTVNDYADDIEEQIEASTIVLKNGADKLQKITIKYRKEKLDGDSQSEPPSIPKPQKVKKSKKPKSGDKNRSSIQTNVETESENSTFLENGDHYSESNDSFSTPSRTNKSTKSKKSKAKSTKFEPSYLQDDDSCSNSDFTKLYGKYSNETNDGTINENSRNVRFNFSGATSTPIRNNNNINNYQSPCSSAKPSYKSNESSSKSSTPRNTFKSLRRRTSNISLLNSTLNENDDSMTSFSMVEPNSFFEAESNDELNQQRLDKALKTIETHLKKDHIDPFSSELCKAFLTKANFPSREHNEFYKLSNTLLSKLSNTRSVTIGDIRFNIEKEIGRGAYGSVYRGVNTNSGDTVALKYQKPPSTWELYICFEVHQRIKDPDMLLGFMDISSAIIAPNASIFVTEFSPFGSLLDINNRIRQSTTKVMHESLVMHFTSQILNIVHYLHSCKIIHGDIKPDNFLLMKIPNPNSDVPTLRLIDFGCAIDMKFFEPKTQFKKVIQTDGFTCPEMLEGRLWSYQTDVFCVAGTVHVMLFGEYMQMMKKFNQYEIKQKLPRYLKKHIWTEFFSTFLNIKDAHKLPNLLKMKEKIDDELESMESELQSQIRTLSNILYKR